MTLKKATREEWRRLRSWYPSTEPTLSHPTGIDGVTDQLKVRGKLLGQVTYTNKRDGDPDYEVDEALLKRMRGTK